MGVSAFAQVTTASLGGKVVDKAGEPVIGAAVVATHEPSGTVYGVVTNEDGRYVINGMRSGGPYKVEVTFTMTAAEGNTIYAYVGGKFQFAFKYVSTTSFSPTWQIRKVVVE